ncbi:MAG: ATP-binding protein [Eubacteriales bacterium]|nr:ATP-binding protein [Eubacteriales bacterium]
MNAFFKNKYLRFLNIKKAIREMDELNEKLMREREIKQEFFANASHELKTPITSIKGYAELLDSGMVTDEEMKKDMISRIKKEADHMTALISDILEVSKLESGEEEPEIMYVDISHMISELIETFKPKAEENKVSIHNYTKENVYIYADYSHIEEIASNLISNAIRYNRKSGKIWINAYNEGNMLIFRVRDTGIGIADDEKEKIFNRFYRVDKGRSKATGGTGLGLSIVKHLLSYYNGTIDVNSKQGSGSEFVVRIPSHYNKKKN